MRELRVPEARPPEPRVPEPRLPEARVAPARATVAGTLLQGARSALWFVRGVMGEDAYDKYLAHHEAVHRDSDEAPPVMSKREFWRDLTDRQDRNPQGRCC